MTPQQCVEKLSLKFGDKTPFKTMLYKLFVESKHGILTFHERDAFLGIAAKQIHTILYDYLHISIAYHICHGRYTYIQNCITK